MSAVVARPLLRSSALRTLPARTVARYESTTAQKATDAAKDAASKASSTASEYQAKAAQGLSRVTSAAGPALAGAAKGVGSALGRVGGPVGRLVGFVERQVPTVLYYSRVGLELSKIVFQGQKMSPPSVSTFQSYFQRALRTIQNPSGLINTASSTANTVAAQPASVAQQLRNLNGASLVAGGVVLAECLGFFTVGEMLGRFKIIGYHGEPEGAHH